MSAASSPERVLMWTRVDVPGSEVVLLREVAEGIVARGSQHAVDPMPYRLEYELRADATGATVRLVARAEGASWFRELELSRDATGWSSSGRADGADDLAAFDGRHLRTAAPGIADPTTLRAAVDVDVGGSPLTNALPVRRLGLLGSPPGRVERLTAAWVLPPTLEVVASTQTYTVVDATHIAYGDAATAVHVAYDPDGWVLDYPSLARRAPTSVVE